MNLAQVKASPEICTQEAGCYSARPLWNAGAKLWGNVTGSNMLDNGHNSVCVKCIRHIQAIGCEVFAEIWPSALCLHGCHTHSFFNIVIPYSTTNSPRLQTPFLSQLSTISARWLESTFWTVPELQWTTQTSPVAVADAHEWTKRESKSLGIAKCCEVSKRKQKERWNKEKHTVGPFSFYIPLDKRRSQQRNESETPCRSAWDLASCKFSYGCKLTLLQLRPDAKSICLEGERSIWAIHLGGLQYYPTAPKYSI